MQQSNFTCPRTCPLVGAFWCRFRPVLDQIGPVRVHSHTATVKVDFADPDALRAAVLAMGGKWLGEGMHRLFSTQHTGLGFTLPGWSYALVAEKAGTLAYDDFNGHWGNPADLERLKAEYAVSKAETAALALGWQCERTAEGLTVYHPSGGHLTVTGATAEAHGFHGQGCHDALLSLGLNLQGLEAKPEFTQVAAEIQIPR